MVNFEYCNPAKLTLEDVFIFGTDILTTFCGFDVCTALIFWLFE